MLFFWKDYTKQSKQFISVNKLFLKRLSEMKMSVNWKLLTATTHSAKSAEWKKFLLDQKRGTFDCFQNISINDYYRLLNSTISIDKCRLKYLTTKILYNFLPINC